MKLLMICAILIVGSIANASVVIEFDPITLRVLRYNRVADTPEYIGRPDVLINPDLCQVNGTNHRFWKVSIASNSVVPWTDQEKTDYFADLAAIQLAQNREVAKSLLDGTENSSLQYKALIKTLIDEINILRSNWNNFKAEVSSSTNLANFQSRVNGMPSLSDRTLGQAKTAIKSKIDDGSVDGE